MIDLIKLMQSSTKELKAKLGRQVKSLLCFIIYFDEFLSKCFASIESSDSHDLYNDQNYQWFQKTIIKPFLSSKKTVPNIRASRLGERFVRKIEETEGNKQILILICLVSEYEESFDEDKQATPLKDDPAKDPIAVQQILNSIALFEKQGEFS